ncbi:MAG: NAD-dependent epimerase/dehydratase family protein [Chloroflexi bacterium]|nr:NAD-dependent epimerase/dehydratase family protein [Chloroflexota bacterium]
MSRSDGESFYPGKFWAGKRVLVTGGAGFIGSRLVDLLLRLGAEITVVDDLSRGRLENLAGTVKHIRFIEGDLRREEVCRQAVADKDVVLNLAAKAVGLGYSMQHHGEMLTDNVLLTTNVLENARQAGVQRFLVISSSCVYPDDAPVPTAEEHAENASPESVNAGYGWAKRMAELQGGYYTREYGMEIAIARPFNCYGPGDYIEGEKAHVIPALVQRVLLADRRLVVWGNGLQTRSFVHVRDMAMMMLLLTEKYPVGDPVNLGHGTEVSIRTLVNQLLDITGKQIEVVYDTTRPTGALRKGADITKLRRVTGYVPRIGLREGLTEVVQDFQQRMMLGI